MPEQLKHYRKSLDVVGAGSGDPAPTSCDEFPEPCAPASGPFSRRDFLRAAGFAFLGAAVAGCSRGPTEYALSPVAPAPGQVPGRTLDYATTCGACSAGCGLLARVRDGRPIKIEGDPDHPLSHGGVCAMGQAALLGLYDRLRLQQPLKEGQPSTWTVVDADIRRRLGEIRHNGGTVRVLSGTLTNPTTRAKVAEFLAYCGNGSHVQYDPLSCSAIQRAHELTHQRRLLPHYLFDQARVIVGVDADFLGTWLSPVEFTAAWSAGRQPTGNPPRMSYHAQFESRLSLTGSKADERYRVLPGEVGLLLTHLAMRLGPRANRPLNTTGIEPPPVPAAVLDRLADSLWQQREHSLIVCGTQEVAHQVLCNFLNDVLGNYGKTLDIDRPSLQAQGDEVALQQLMQDLRGRHVDALVVLDCNPVYDLPNGEEFAGLLRQVPLTVACAERPDETTAACKYVCPLPHPLAAWGDAEPVRGLVSLAQPTMLPLEDSRPVLEILARWMGRPRPALDSIQEYWRAKIYPRRQRHGSFQEFWDNTLRDGHAEINVPQNQRPTFDPTQIQPVLRATRPASGEFTLALYPKVSLRDGRHAYNPWLQELPDPITKVAWDNYACLSLGAAQALGVETGSVIRMEVSGGPPALELPVLVQPGQHDQVVAVALGYGSQASARFGDIGPAWLEARPTLGPNGRVGVNAGPWVARDGTRGFAGRNVRLSRVGRQHPLACTQQHHSIQIPHPLAPPGHESRPAIRETTLTLLGRGLQTTPQQGAHGHEEQANLWPPDHATAGHRWAMCIDLGACTGCSACVVACQVENNIPVVGKDEVRRQREMHWLRIDRYYSEHAGTVDVAFQPMLCQHCGNAPCETVCPVLATVHSTEGLNQQVYNRCVGTRYCANNCPYKVRRFNWFDYAHEDMLQNLTLNPDVTVRSRGVMEKCTFCVQRIQEARIAARARGETLRDGAVQTACQQSCPAHAIVFGDLSDPNSRVSQQLRDPRRYRVLAELNVQPSVNYLEIVRNRRPE
jgi:molybdopterin-containing oxidoreductase family iron-sulfur binding subunit